MAKIYNILILCTGNSARSILGEGLINHLGQGRLCGYSAGSRPTGAPNPLALAVLRQNGIDPSFARSKSWDEFATPDAPVMDIVLTVCDSAAAEECPYWPGAPITAHWGLPDPAAAPEATRAAAFAQTYAALARRVAALAALPIETMEPATLKAQLAAIGAMA
jgi:protein-tyrosine-phosphatase